MSSHLAVVLPGGGYGPAGPALQFPALALEQRGAVVRNISYPHDPRPTGFDLDENRSFFAAVRELVQSEIDFDTWDTVTFVAKSLGTLVLGAVGRELRLPPRVGAVWVTPIFEVGYVRDAAIALGWRSLIVSGTADPYYDRAATDAVVRELDANHIVIDGADHRLVVKDDVLATIEGTRRMAEATLDLW
jgi:hypothetical protein